MQAPSVKQSCMFVPRPVFDAPHLIKRHNRLAEFTTAATTPIASVPIRTDGPASTSSKESEDENATGPTDAAVGAPPPSGHKSGSGLERRHSVAEDVRTVQPHILLMWVERFHRRVPTLRTQCAFSRYVSPDVCPWAHPRLATSQKSNRRTRRSKLLSFRSFSQWEKAPCRDKARPIKKRLTV